MATQIIRVGVNGYGVIGKRVADAVRAQPDMTLVGISDVVTDYRVKTADVLGLRVFASLPEKVAEMRGADIPQTVVPDLDVVTMAAKAAHTQCHLHYWTVELTRPVSRDEILDVSRAAPRVAFVRMRNGIVALNSTVELMRDLGRPRGDLWEVALWEDVLAVQGREAFYTYQVFNEAIVVPETIDAVRALAGHVKDGAVSTAVTDRALGLRRDFLVRVPEPTPA